MAHSEDVDRLFSWLKAPALHYREFVPQREVADAVATWPVAYRAAVQAGVAAEQAPPQGDSVAKERLARDRMTLPTRPVQHLPPDEAAPYEPPPEATSGPTSEWASEMRSEADLAPSPEGEPAAPQWVSPERREARPVPTAGGEPEISGFAPPPRLGFPVENLVGRVALVWPPPATPTTEFPTIPLAPPNAANPVRVVAEGVRKPITDSLLSYAGTKDPVSGLTWGGVVKTGGDVLVSYDDGFVGAYAGGGGWFIDGKSVKSNSEVEGLVGAYVRPYRTGLNAFKVGLNLSVWAYDKNLRFFTFGQGGYFSPQTYFNVGVPLEYSGRSGRLTYLVGGAIGVQHFHEDRSPFYPLEPAKQAALQAAGNRGFYGARTKTGPAFSGRGQVEYQLDNGFSMGALAGVDNAQDFTEGIAKLYLRKSFGIAPVTASALSPLPGRL